MGLRQRVILIITIPALLAIGVHGALRVRQQHAQLLAAEKKTLALTAKAVQIAVENSLRAGQWTDVNHLVSEMVERQDAIDRIRLFDRKAQLIFVSNPLKIGDTIPAEALRRVISSGISEEFYAPRANQSVLTMLVPVRGALGIDGAMEIARLSDEMDDRVVAAIIDVLVRLGLLLCVTVGLTAFVLQRQVLRPLDRLAEGIQRLGRGESGVALAVDRGDELGQVAQQFNEMTQRLRDAHERLLAETERAFALEQQARQTGALAVAGKLAVALAHEVGTPLNIISGRAEYLLSRLPEDDPARKDLIGIVDQIDRISGIIASLLDTLRPQKPMLGAVRLSDVFDRLVPLVAHAARRRDVALDVEARADLPALCADANQLQQVLINLLVNAIEASPPAGRVDVTATEETREGREGIAIHVSDSGPGVAPELRAAVFQPFFTTKPRGQGTGLGLAICRDIVRDHGGTIEVADHAGGAMFVVWLPASHESG
jgi:signal transduction histidine kinase